MKFLPRSAGGFIASTAILGLLAYGGVVGFFYLGQERLIFSPTTLPASYPFAIPDTTEISLPVDGATISALHFKQPSAKGVIFFLHGNGGNLASWLPSTDFYRKNNYDVFMIDYRGYGKSSGSIESEAQLHADVLAAWNSIAPQYEGKKRVIFGRSLGTTLAAKLSTQVRSDWTVLVSPFSSLDGMRQEFYPFLPSALMRYRFRTDQWLPHANSKVTIVHGDRDEVINYSHAERLRTTVPRAELIKIDGGTHYNLHQLPQYVDVLAKGLAKL